jgi:hypothetical protein
MGKPWENGDLYSNNGWLVVTGTWLDDDFPYTVLGSSELPN